MMNELNDDKPQLARQQKAPRQSEFAATPKDEYCLEHLILLLLVFVVGFTRKVLKSLVMCISYYSKYAVQDNPLVKSSM